MKNILLITELYPLPTKENKSTYVCHFYAREWTKLGYNVIVVHFQPIYCRLFHLIIKLFPNFLQNHLGGIYYSRKIVCTESYEYEGVNVYRVPIYIPIPHGKFPKKSVDSFTERVYSILEDANFVPDVITGHMLPLEIIPNINKKYKAKTCMVSHGMSHKTKQRYPDYRGLLDSFDLWGFRSKAIREEFISEFGKPVNSFYCYSGIPKEYVCDKNPHLYSKRIGNFIFVGDLIQRKHPDALLHTIPQIFDEYSITFIGEGPEYEHLQNIIKQKNIKNVCFTGKLDRNEILKLYDKSDCMIMISHNEAFGLVYLESMARGCISIASRNEGIDGIVKDGYNGFLCKAGDVQELCSIIRRIRNMREDELISISENAINTVKQLNNEQVALDYLNNLVSLC